MKFIKTDKIKPFFLFFGVLLVLYTILLFIPILWGLLSSIKSVEEFRLNLIWFPEMITLENFYFVFNKFNVSVLNQGAIINVGMIEQFGNTLLYVLGCSFVSAAVPCLMAYLNTKFEYRLNSLIYVIVVVTMMLPIVGSFPSEIQVLKTIGIFNSIPGMWIRSATFLGLYFLVFRATFKGISKEFSEAAYVDGGSEWIVMTRIMFPLVRVTFLTVMLIKGIEYWNDYEIPRLFLPSHPTLAYGIFEMSFTADNEFNNVPMRMTSCYTLMIPIFILFMVFRNKLMGNLSMGGVKE